MNVKRIILASALLCITAMAQTQLDQKRMPVSSSPQNSVDASSNQTTGGNTTFTGTYSHRGAETFSGGMSVLPSPLNTFSGNVNGGINPQNYGAQCDGVTDDTSAFQHAIHAAFPNNGHSTQPLLIPATGHACIVSQLNLTNINNEINIIGLGSIAGFQSIIQCVENTSNMNVCIDFSGSQYISVRGVDFYGGTSVSNAPRITVLFAKSRGGNSQIIHWDDVTVEGYGDYQVYNYGGEVWNCYYCNFYQHGSGGVDLVRLTAKNELGVTSPFLGPLPSAPMSMTKVNLWAVWSAGGTADALALESSNSPISSVTIGGFGNLNSANYFVRVLPGSGEVHGLTIRNLRVEPSCAQCGLFNANNNNLSQFVIDDVQWAALHSPSVTLVNMDRVQASSINLRPGDSQLQFPSVPVITCKSVAGLEIFDYIKYGGGPQINSCTGAVEMFSLAVDGNGAVTAKSLTIGAGFPNINHIIGPTDQPLQIASQSNQSIALLPNGSGTVKIGKNSVTQTVASGIATMTTASIPAGSCGSTVTISAPGVVSTDVILWSLNAPPGGSNAGIVTWPTANNVNFAYCPNIGERPAAATINWRVLR